MNLREQSKTAALVILFPVFVVLLIVVGIIFLTGWVAYETARLITGSREKAKCPECKTGNLRLNEYSSRITTLECDRPECTYARIIGDEEARKRLKSR